MKYKINIFIFAGLCFLYTAFIHGQSSKASFKITTNVESSQIFIDNNFVGNGVYNSQLLPGKYFVDVMLDSLKWNEQHFADTIKIEDSKPVNLNFNFKKKIYLETNPSNAYVYKNDSLIGYTPLFLNSDFNSLKLERADYQNKKITADDVKTVNFINLNYIGKPNGKSFYEKDIFKILVGSIVILGGTTAYFKLKADNRFSNYESTGEQNYLTETRKFDLISGISMGLLQINFGILIYYFLSN